ncbi:MAG: hypothetical protein M0Z50_17780 [Planctomycetia bacterium]|nr:hypothetical protein [Planctomycetia bacterium]
MDVKWYSKDCILPQQQISGVSGAGEFHPRALAEPDMSLSAHPAPIIAFAIILWRDSDGPVCEQVWLSLRQVTQVVPSSSLVGSESLVFPLRPAHQPPIQMAEDTSERRWVEPPILVHRFIKTFTH